MRVGAAAFAGDGVHAFHVFRAQIEELLRDESDSLVLARMRLHRFVEVVYAASTIAAEWVNSEISSCVLISRASDISC